MSIQKQVAKMTAVKLGNIYTVATVIHHRLPINNVPIHVTAPPAALLNIYSLYMTNWPMSMRGAYIR